MGLPSAALLLLPPMLLKPLRVGLPVQMGSRLRPRAVNGDEASSVLLLHGGRERRGVQWSVAGSGGGGNGMRELNVGI